jgi:hypothetical protein
MLVWIKMAAIWVLLLEASMASEKTVSLRGEVLDAENGELIPSRVYVQSKDGHWYFPQSASPSGSSVLYRKTSPAYPDSVEMHVTLSAHPFRVDLPPGEYTVTVEQGKEYFPSSQRVTVGSQPVEVKFKLTRWIDMQQRGWYSGDTHVHRNLEELPNVMLAEDLNIAFPLLYWVTEAFTAPGMSPQSASRPPEPKEIPIDPTHVIYPLNTEYEIFRVGGKSHTLGAFFVLNHRTVFQEGVPPVVPIAKRAHSEGALLELDKHNWPWSTALVPVMGVDLYELANNHVWRTEFGYRDFGEQAPEYMNIERDSQGWTERGWLDYTFQNYYALLNCGFKLRPTAGTASGVHPVPLGFGRVYVHLDGRFSSDAWVRALDQGKSFITTGPMLLVRLNDRDPGYRLNQTESPVSYRLTGSAFSPFPLQRIEIIMNGKVARAVKPRNRKTDQGAFESLIDESMEVQDSSWIAVRCFEDRPDKRVRFAHSSPFFIDVPGRPLRPRSEEVQFLIERVEAQIARSVGVIPEAALEEYREALRIYQGIAKSAR